MKLTECYINNFGKLSDFSYRFKSDLNVIKGENGYGKSTLVAFIKAMLFGLSDTKKQKLDENDRKKYEPWQGGIWGGSLNFTKDGKNFRIERRFSKKAADDECRIFDLDTGKELAHSEGELGEELFGIDSDGFERTVMLSERQLSDKCDNKTIAAKLSDLSGVEADISELDEAVKLLDEERKFYYRQGGGGKIAEAKEMLHFTEQKRAELEALLKKHIQDLEHITRLSAELNALKSEMEKEKELVKALAVKREIYSQYQEKTALIKNESAKLQALRTLLGDEAPDRNIIYEYERRAREVRRLDSEIKSGIRELSDHLRLPSKKELSELVNEYEEIEQKRAQLFQNRIEKINTGAERNKKIKKSLCLSALLISAVSIITGAVLHPLFFLLLLISAGLFVLAFFKKETPRENYENEEDFLNEHEEELKKKLSIYTDIKDVKLALSELQEKLCEKEKHETELDKKKAAFKEEYEKLVSISEHFPVFKRLLPSEILERCNEYEFSEKMLKKLHHELYETEEKYGFSKNDAPKFTENEKNLLLESDLAEKEKALALLKNKYHSDSLALEELDDISSESDRLKENIQLYQERLNILKKTKEFLETAKDNLNAKYLGKTRSAFVKYAERISKKNEELNLDTSFSVYKNEGGQTKSKEAYSKGLRDMYSFALRLALIDSLYEKEKPFIIIDDAFAYFDDKKTKTVKSLLSELSKDMQIIYMTASESRAL